LDLKELGGKLLKSGGPDRDRYDSIGPKKRIPAKLIPEKKIKKKPMAPFLLVFSHPKSGD